MAINLSQQKIDIALPKIQEGLRKYLWLQGEVNKGESFHQDPIFRRRFNHFYRVRRGTDWQDKFYLLMGHAMEKGLNFAVILDELQKATMRLEASFASKLYATINPSAPVIDSIVLGNVGLRLPYFGAPNRATRICQIHGTLENLFDAYLNTSDGVYLINEFDRVYPDAKAKVTDQKKLDLVLWQTRQD